MTYAKNYKKWFSLILSVALKSEKREIKIIEKVDILLRDGHSLFSTNDKKK